MFNRPDVEPPRTDRHSFYKQSPKNNVSMEIIKPQIDVVAEFFRTEADKINPVFEESKATFHEFKQLMEKQQAEFYSLLKNQDTYSKDQIKIFRENLLPSKSFVEILQAAYRKLSSFLRKIESLLKQTDESHYLYEELITIKNSTEIMKEAVRSQVNTHIDFFNALGHSVTIIQKVLRESQTEEMAADKNHEFIRDLVKVELFKKQDVEEERKAELMSQENTEKFIQQTALIYSKLEKYKEKSGNTAKCEPIPCIIQGFVASLKHQPRQTVSFRG